MTSDDSTYRGETKRRKKWVAVLLTYLCPGLGYLYVGKFIKGLTINLVFLLMLEGFIVAFSVLKFFPILPFIVFGVGWLVFTTLMAIDISHRAARLEDDYVLAGHNHWSIYLVVFLLSFLAPIVVTIDFTRTNLWRLDTVENAGMYPSIQPGETVLVDRTAFRSQAVRRGDIVGIGSEATGGLQFLRVVGAPHDAIRMKGKKLYVNNQAVAHSPLGDAQSPDGPLADQTRLLAQVEHNAGARYVISTSPRLFSELATPPTQLDADEYFLLADNRGHVPLEGRDDQIRDSRNFGPVTGEQLAGIPRFIFWSVAPDGSVRWDRIGLRVRPEVHASAAASPTKHTDGA